ncbi:TMEM175 family protein [Lentilactobacillus laojiaonis]|uniref:TMEM175 family protein n=1 Tax=Lentilactobacillus laojiaonis TaxID=2883998 RepID=UPI001D09AF1E|nr:TMEM175 family protein [Lentilactobacillus laojiaonis]UDM32400.1 TMEM175 family protein [Lentilactobacillus laojiaonis]
MNKEQLEPFTDGVTAIIMTIMVLEIKTPEVDDISALFKESTHFIAFIISFCFICAAWYNHRYLLNNSENISKKVFWINNWWLLSMAIIPVSTSWVSSFPLAKAPEYFYFFVFLIWTFAYHTLDKVVYDENKKLIDDQFKDKEVTKIRNFHYLFDLGVGLVGLIGIYFLPVVGLVLIVIQIISWVIINPTNYNISEL